MPKKTYGKTKSGVEITDELIEQYVAEAEEGYDLDKLTARRLPADPADGSGDTDR